MDRATPGDTTARRVQPPVDRATPGDTTARGAALTVVSPGAGSGDADDSSDSDVDTDEGDNDEKKKGGDTAVWVTYAISKLDRTLNGTTEWHTFNFADPECRQYLMTTTAKGVDTYEFWAEEFKLAMHARYDGGRQYVLTPKMERYAGVYNLAFIDMDRLEDMPWYNEGSPYIRHAEAHLVTYFNIRNGCETKEAVGFVFPREVPPLAYHAGK